jgi:hypothetical protein
MKTILSVCVVAAFLAGSALADPPAKSNFSAHAKPSTVRANKEPAPLKKSEVVGALPRAFQRGGNPLQMLNPRAPAKYGNWVQSTSFDSDVPGKWKGIKLFELVF